MRVSAEKCLVDGCERREELKDGRPAGGGLCAGHRYRKKLQAQGKLRVPFESPIADALGRQLTAWEAVVDAAVTLRDAPAEELESALRSLRWAATRAPWPTIDASGYTAAELLRVAAANFADAPDGDRRFHNAERLLRFALHIYSTKRRRLTAKAPGK
jgi:hypothetical protein